MPISPVHEIECVLPIRELPLGDVFPNRTDSHPSWELCPGWDDPVAGRHSVVRAPQKVKCHDPEDDAHWIGFNAGGLNHDADRALILHHEDWLSVQVSAEFESREETVGTTLDDATPRLSRVGLVFAQRTSRHYHLFCVEGRRTLAIYRRADDDWTVLHRQDFHEPLGRVELSLELKDGRLEASCATLGFSYSAAWEGEPLGKVGYRSLGASLLHALSSRGRLRSESGQARDRGPRLGQFREEFLGTLTLPEGVRVRSTFSMPGQERTVLLCWQAAGLFVQDWEGRVIWRHPGHFLPQCVRFSLDSRKIYALSAPDLSGTKLTPTGKALPAGTPDHLQVLDATTGNLLGRLELPEDPELEDDIVLPRAAHGAEWDIGAERGMASQGGAIDFVLKRDFWDGWRTIWAYDGERKLLWRRRVRLPYGHHYAVRVLDLDGDGELEVLAGGTAFRQDGRLWWEHDRGNDLLRTIGGGHYDAVWVTRDPATGQAARVLLLSGSAGVFALDPLTGETLSHLPIGHAQAAVTARLYPRQEFEQCIVVTRWGNPGILTGLDGEANRLWTIQPDYIGQGCLPVRVKGQAYNLLWVNTSRQSQGIYDGDGEFVAGLPGIQRIWDTCEAKQLRSMVLETSPHSGPDLLAIHVDRELHLFQVIQG
jgi:hypothetical protein